MHDATLASRWSTKVKCGSVRTVFKNPCWIGGSAGTSVKPRPHLPVKHGGVDKISHGCQGFFNPVDNCYEAGQEPVDFADGCEVGNIGKTVVFVEKLEHLYTEHLNFCVTKPEITLILRCREELNTETHVFDRHRKFWVHKIPVPEDSIGECKYRRHSQNVRYCKQRSRQGSGNKYRTGCLVRRYGMDIEMNKEGKHFVSATQQLLVCVKIIDADHGELCRISPSARI